MSILRKHWFLAAVLIAAVLCFVLPMGDLQWMTDDILIRAAFYGALLFIIIYTFMAPWWRNAAGRMFVVLDFGIICALLGAIIHAEFGDSMPKWLTFRIISFGLALVSGAIISRIIVLGIVHKWNLHLPWNHRRGSNEPERKL
jgi:hypothetical protein